MTADPRIYKKGTAIAGGLVSIGTNDTAFTGLGTNFNGADLEGAALYIYPTSGEPFLVGHVAAIDPRFPVGGWPALGPVQLEFPWNGAPIVEQPYLLLLSAATVPSSLGTTLLGKFVAFLESAGMFFDGRDVPAENVTDFAQRALFYDAETRTLRSWRNAQFYSVDVIGKAFDPVGPWVVDIVDKAALAISTGETDIDFDTGTLGEGGVRHFKLTADDDTEFQLPTNVEIGSKLLVQVTIDTGPHAITFASGFEIGDLEIEPADGAYTLLALEVTDETGGTATAVTVSRFPYAENQLVAHGSDAFVSNVDENTSEPLIVDGVGVSNAFWTVLPKVQGERGPAGLAGFSYAFDDSTNTGADPAAGFLRVNNADLAAVTAIALALVDSDGINRQDQIESYGPGVRVEIKVRDGAAKFAAYRLTAAPTIVSSRAVLTVELIDKMSAFTDEQALDIVFGGDKGEPGYIPGRPFTFDTTITDSDPGSGKLRFNHGTFASITEIYVDDLALGGGDIGDWIENLSSGNPGNNRGELKFFDASDPEIYRTFLIVGDVTDASGYWKIPVAPLTQAGSFPNALEIVEQFEKRGQPGQDGETPGYLFAYDDTITESEPAAGRLRFNHGTFASITKLIVSNRLFEAGTPDIGDNISGWGGSTNPDDKGRVIVKKIGAPENQATFKITDAVTSHSGDWFEVPVEPVGTLLGSLADDDPISVEVLRTGNAGTAEGAVTEINGITPTAGVVDLAAADIPFDPAGLDNTDAENVQEAIEDHDAAIEDKANTADLGNAAFKDTGTGPGDVAAGDHTHSGVYEPVNSAIVKTNVAGQFAGLSEKTTLHANDLIIIEDSEDSGAKKKAKKSNIGGGIATGYAVTKYLAPGGPATWTKPAGLKAIRVRLQASGGDGAAPAPAPSSSGGGGAGGYGEGIIPAPTLPGPQPVTVGPGTVSFGSFISATAGSTAPGPTAGASGIGSGPGVDFVKSALIAALPGAENGDGGHSFMGAGGVRNPGPAPSDRDGNPGTGFGSGGAGGANGPTGGPGGASGTGAPPIIIVEEFY